MTFSVSVVGDDLSELNETFIGRVSNLMTGGLNVQLMGGGGTLDGTGTITDDDPATLSIDDAIMAEGDGGTTNFIFTVTLDTAVDVAVTVEFSTTSTPGTATAPGDFSSTTTVSTGLVADPGGTLDFAGTVGETETITVVVVADGVTENTEDFFISLSNVMAGGRDVTIMDASGQGTITNDDSDPVADDDADVTPRDTLVNMNLTGNTAGGGDDPGDSDADGDLDVTTVSLSAVGGIGGGVYDNNDGSVDYTSPADTIGDATFTYTISDAAGNVSNTGNVTVTVQNTPPVAVDDPGQVATEDIPLLIDVDANDTDGSVVSGVAPDTIVITQAPMTVFGTVVGMAVPTTDGTGRVTFTPAANFNSSFPGPVPPNDGGAVTFKYTIEDGDREMRREAAQRGGRRLAQGWASSSWAARRRSVASSP